MSSEVRYSLIARVEPVEHVVHALGFDNPLAVTAVERIERATQHRLEHVGHAQRLACRPGESDGRRFLRRADRDTSAVTDRPDRRGPAATEPAVWRTASGPGRNSSARTMLNAGMEIGHGAAGIGSIAISFGPSQFSSGKSECAADDAG